ncbi:MAG: lytS3 [Defluviitaleaceae bacterium]|jgi:sensor histidine kinase YesM|nr:lytS3 [Defluviitaleaceae bacterium]MDK2904915.1 two-component system, LytTR family, sensor kinase [Eubacteriaceae bacterium]
MSFKQVNNLFPFNRLLKFLIGLAIGVQIIVILYNHFNGYYILDGYTHFLTRLLRGTLLSILAGFLISYPDLYVIQYMNKIAPWGKSIFKRVSLQLMFTVSIAAVVATLITLFANWISAYTDHDIASIVRINILIYMVVNIMVMSIFEGWILFIERAKAKQMADNLQTELSQIKFEVLKSQINPHFMFNSLNVLSGLINKDVNKAQQFIDEFSMIYRYVLETIEQPVTTLGKEIEFMRSYLFLQQIRYGENLTYSINITAGLIEMFLPPLSLQVVLENAIKHNIINESKPLHIEITDEEFTLIVKNNIQPKISKEVSTGLGLKNLIKRYALISDLVPEFKVENNHYIAKLPLIKIENHESTDH